MDVLSHGLWALAIFWGTSYRWWAFLVGMLPDLLSFGILFVQRIFTGGFTRGPPMDTPAWLDIAYSITHSFITWIVVGVILYFVWRKVWPIVGAAVAHVALDVPTHCSYFPTPFLEPLSDYRFCGISWGTPLVLFLNWTSLAIIFILIWHYEHSRKDRTHKGSAS
jgi:hypothetical protein